MLPMTQALRSRSSKRRLKIAGLAEADHMGVGRPLRPPMRQDGARFGHADGQMACQQQGPEQWQSGVEPSVVEPQANGSW